jgi:class 3 adenylate cyclase
MAIRCAAAIRQDVAAPGIQVRAGIHTGEVDLTGDDITGTPDEQWPLFALSAP